jgi:superfamily II DNA or RNA helicase
MVHGLRSLTASQRFWRRRFVARLEFLKTDPDKGYVTNNLLLPRAYVNERAIKESLTFVHGVEEIWDGDELIGTRPALLKTWGETSTHIIAPREFVEPSKYKLYNFPFINTCTMQFEHVPVGDRITLRDKIQERALTALHRHRAGTLNLACGRGKTVIALKLMAEMRVPTIVVVNTTALLEQWKEAIAEHLDAGKVGVVQGDVADWRHPVTVAMVHTLSSRSLAWPPEFRRWFGLTIYDEGHHMSAPVFVQSADLFYGKRFSLTATARRLDGLEGVYQNHLGRIIYTELTQDLIPFTTFHVLDWELPEEDEKEIVDVEGEPNISKVRTYLGGLEWRNKIIRKQILKDIADDRNILVLSHSKPHVDELAKMVKMGWAITGDTKQENRMSILHQCNPVFATFHLAREGLDKPELDTLYVVTPFTSPNDLQQAWGRIQRAFDGKKPPMVRVFEDTGIKQCIGACRKLKTFLKALKYPFKRVRSNDE